MASIHVLSPHIANQIAAGEVVERPASVVKELVENAIDAGASAVTIEIDNGGVDRIRILDNGCGIADDDAETAFLRHATSKISTANDLFGIRSLGFRGEALASIAAVSRVTLQTQTEADELGTLIRYEGGSLTEHKRIGGTRGTSVTVEGLFYNVPARLKFLKSARAESAAIGDYVSKLILASPQIAVHFVNNGKSIYRSDGNGSLRDALISVYGVSVLDSICPILFDDGYIRITGYIGTPELSSANRSGQTFTLNGRIIRSNALSNALMRAYDTRLLIGRFPFAVVALSLSFSEADVNVHPAKLEVRFVDEARVARSLVVACSEALIKSYVPSMSRQAEGERETAPAPMFRPTTPQSHTAEPAMSRTTLSGDTTQTAAPRFVRESVHADEASDIPRFRLPPNPIVPARPKQAESVQSPFSSPYTVIGAAFNAYWFVQQDDCIYCVDQHAAHERLLYDALMTRAARLVSQTLFLPEEVRLLPTEEETFSRYRASLEEFGFVFSDVSETGVTLLAVPQMNGKPMGGAFLRDALARLSTDGEVTAEELIRGALTQCACKHAVKAGEPITPQEMQTLIELLKSSETLLTCPHGRPVAVRITRTDVEKMFQRIPS